MATTANKRRASAEPAGSDRAGSALRMDVRSDVEVSLQQLLVEIIHQVVECGTLDVRDLLRLSKTCR